MTSVTHHWHPASQVLFAYVREWKETTLDGSASDHAHALSFVHFHADIGKWKLLINTDNEIVELDPSIHYDDKEAAMAVAESHDYDQPITKTVFSP